MNKKNKIYRYLTNVATGITGRKVIVSDVVHNALGYTSKGNQIHVAFEHPFYDDIRKEAAKTMDSSLVEAQVDMVRTGITVHEALHQVFTNFSYENAQREKLKMEGFFTSEYDMYIYHELINLVEDPAIEGMAPQVVGGMPLKALHMTIRTIDRLSDYSDEAEDEIHDLTKALIQFGDIGIVKNKWTFPKAREVFLKIAPMFYDAINEPNGKKRIDAVRPILEEVRTLYREGAKPNKAKDGTNEQLSRSSSPSGSGRGKSGKSSSSESKLNRKRKITIKRVKRDEWEKMKKESEENGELKDDGKSDLTIIVPEDAKAEEGKRDNKDAASVPVSSSEEGENTSENPASGSSRHDETKKNSEDNASSESDQKKSEESEEPKSKEPSKSDETASKEDEESEHNSSSKADKSESEKPDDSENKDSTESGKGESNDPSKADDSKSKASEMADGKDSSKSETEKASSNNGKPPENGLELDMSKPGYAESEEDANPFELTDEELEEIEDDNESIVSDEDLGKFEGMIDSILETATRDSSEDKVKEECNAYDSYAEVTANELHTSAKCKNIIVHADPNAAKPYEKLIAPFEADIEMLQNDLKEIFRNDSSRDYYARSGSISLKRMTSKIASTRLFERTERSSEKESIAIYIMVDMSGSTSGDKIRQEKLAAILTAEALSVFNIPLFITGFTEYYDVQLFHFVRGENTEEERYSLLNIESMNNNFDAYVVRYAEEMLKVRPEKRKLFIMISDGQPASAFSHGAAGVKQNAEAVAHMKEEGINVLAFGVGNVPQELFKHMYGNAFIDVSNISQLFNKLADALRIAINGEDDF
mgnify:CR=1 FL=1